MLTTVRVLFRTQGKREIQMEFHPRERAFVSLLQRREAKHLRRYKQKVWLRQTQSKTHSRFIRLLPAISMTLGILLLTSAFLPIASYLAFTSPELAEPKLVSALPEVPIVRQSQTHGTVAAATADQIQPRIIQNNLDYTNLSNWFPSAAAAPETQAHTVKEYTISIPSLNVEQAVVKIGGTDLSNNLIQYPGTANPGEFGAPVIFGHSTLRQFYNPSLKNPRRYYSIFSKIMTLKQGDEIIIEYDGIRYTYSVQRKVEVKPEDTYILEQEYSARQLKLITCVPEGTYLRRGVVLAQLEEREDTYGQRPQDSGN